MILTELFDYPLIVENTDCIKENVNPIYWEAIKAIGPIEPNTTVTTTTSTSSDAKHNLMISTLGMISIIFMLFV